MLKETQKSPQSTGYKLTSEQQIRTSRIISQIGKSIELGCIMKLILMQAEGLKIVEQIILIIRKMKNSSLLYKRNCDESMQTVRECLFSGSSPEQLMEISKTYREREKVLAKQSTPEIIRSCREQMIESIVEQLYNAKQNLPRVQQFQCMHIQSGKQQTKPEIQKTAKQYLALYGKKHNDDLQLEISQLRKLVLSKDSENKAIRKIVEEGAKTLREKQEKIASLKNTISKLEQHIIRQVKQQGEVALEYSQQVEYDRSVSKVRNQSSLFKSQSLEKQVVVLKREIENLKKDLSKSTELISQKDKEIMKLNVKSKLNAEFEKEKQNQFLALSMEYSQVKDEVAAIINKKQMRRSSHNQDSPSEEEDKDDLGNFITLKAELEILSDKYNKLEKVYSELKQQHHKLVVNQPASAKRLNEMSLQLNSELKNFDSGSRNSGTLGLKESNIAFKTPRLLKNTTSNKMIDIVSDQQSQIIREISRPQHKSQALSITGFDSLISPKQMAAKIQGFDYSSSIIHKVNYSKFINSFQAKLSFILQYVCLLELYFTRGFLSCVREQLMMEDSLSIKTLTLEDLNPVHFADGQQQQESSFISNNANNISKNGSVGNGKLIINAQYSISECGDEKKPYGDVGEDALTGSVSSMPNPLREKNRQKIEKVQAEFKQIESLISNQFLNPQELKDDPQFRLHVQKLRHNSIAQIISNLIKQNQVFKKCLNQMIKNEENFTKLNNEIYFDEDGELRRRSSSNLEAKPAGPTDARSRNKDDHNQNCAVM